jgi:hypothetical protein
VKLNTLTSFAHPLRRRAPQIAVLGCLAFAAQVACSDAPTQGGTPTPFPTSGTTSGGSVANTAGTTTTTAAGTFATGGGGTFSAGGTGFETGGTAGSTAGTASGGSAGSTAGTGGTTVVVPPTPYCMGKTLEPLPYPVKTGFQPSGWSEGPPVISNPTDLAFDACTERVAGAAAVGDCSKWRYTPSATPGAAWVIWSLQWEPNYRHDNVCLAEGATAIAFCARGVAGGEKIQVGGAGVAEAEITLTNEWALYKVPLTSPDYNSFESGVPSGFDWKVVPAAVPSKVEFFIDKLQFMKDVPADYCGGADSGEGGAGGGAQ